MNERMMTRRTGKAISATLLAVVPSASDASVSYEIKQSNRDGVVYCSCPSWKYDMDGKRLVGYARPSKDRSCKHTRAYAAGLLTPPTVGRVETMAPKPPRIVLPRIVLLLSRWRWLVYGRRRPTWSRRARSPKPSSRSSRKEGCRTLERGASFVRWTPSWQQEGEHE